MSELEMPTTEAENEVLAQDERASYELAFHILPTVVEGEVPAIFDALKESITSANGEIFDEEAPQRFDLAYEIEQYIEGKNRDFGSAYFGWIRFKAESSSAETITRAVAGRQDILRHLLIRLTKEEEMNPFRFHEALTDKRVQTVDEAAPQTADAGEGAGGTLTEGEDDTVSEEDLEDVLKKSTA